MQCIMELRHGCINARTHLHEGGVVNDDGILHLLSRSGAAWHVRQTIKDHAGQQAGTTFNISPDHAQKLKAPDGSQYREQ